MKKKMKEMRLTLFTRLMLILSACILPVCILSLASNSHEQGILYMSAVASQQTNAAFSLSSLEQEVQRLKSITYSYMNDKDFQQLALIYRTLSDYKRAECINNVRSKLSHIRQISSYVANIYVYLPGLGRSFNAINCDYELNEDVIVRYMSVENLAKPILNDQGKLMVRSYYPAFVTTERLPVMLLGVELDTATIRATLTDTAGHGDTALIGEDWCISTDPSMPYQHEYDELKQLVAQKQNTTASLQYGGEECLFALLYSEKMDATIVVWTPRKEVLGALIWTQKILWLMLAASVVALIGTASALYRMVHKPTRRLVEAFKQVENGNNKIRLSSAQTDEFQYLYTHFNQMMEQINSLIDQVYTQKILYQQSQLKQLQMQINPHFFYNSFFAIQGMLEVGDIETAGRMLQNIGNYFRFITRSGQDVVSLEAEVEHARSYCDIQSIRFENITVNFQQLDRRFADFQVPRLILQPLIENAYIYGLEDKEGEGMLNVSFATTDRLLQIRVEDDGGGMSERRLAKLNENLAAAGQGETTGMLNIQRRLKLFFGDEAGIVLTQNTQNGLVLVISMPLEGKRNV